MLTRLLFIVVLMVCLLSSAANQSIHDIDAVSSSSSSSSTGTSRPASTGLSSSTRPTSTSLPSSSRPASTAAPTSSTRPLFSSSTGTSRPNVPTSSTRVPNVSSPSSSSNRGSSTGTSARFSSTGTSVRPSSTGTSRPVSSTGSTGRVSSSSMPSTARPASTGLPSSSRPASTAVPTSTRPVNSSSTGTSRPNVPTSSNRPSFSSSSAAPSGPNFAPSGSTGYYGPITSATANWTGAVWLNANNSVTTINTKNGQTYTVNLNTRTPPGSRPVVPGRIRAVYHNHAGNVMFVEDRANRWIALYGLDAQLQVYATMNITGFRTFEVSQSGQYVAAAYSSPGMKYIQYIDMYDTFAKVPAGYQYLYTLQLNQSMQVRDLKFHQGGSPLNLMVGRNNTIASYLPATGQFLTTQNPTVVSGAFELQVAIVQDQSIAMMDCDRSIVVFNYGTLFSPRVTMNAFNVQRFNVTQQCEESLVAFGLNSYAVMDSPTRMTYFTVTSSGVSSSSSRPYVPTSSARPVNSSSTGTSRPNVPTSSPVQSSSTGPAGPSFYANGSTLVYGPSITSATGNWSGAVWVQANNTVTTINTQNGQTYTVDLNVKTPAGARSVIPGRIRAVWHAHLGNVMFVEDRANRWIALYGLDGALQVYSTMNMSNFATFEVSQTGQYLAVGYFTPDSSYLSYVDMYDLFAVAPGGYAYLYRLQTDGLMVRDIKFHQAGKPLNVMVGRNNTISSYDPATGRFLSNLVVTLPSAFQLDTAIVQDNIIIMMDCDRATLVFNYGAIFSPSASVNVFNMQAFDSPTQCMESLVAFGPQLFAVMNGRNRMTYFMFGNAPAPTRSSSSSVPFVSSSVSPVQSSSSSGSLHSSGAPGIPSSSSTGSPGPVIDDKSDLSDAAIALLVMAAFVIGIAVGMAAVYAFMRHQMNKKHVLRESLLKAHEKDEYEHETIDVVSQSINRL